MHPSSFLFLLLLAISAISMQLLFPKPMMNGVGMVNTHMIMGNPQLFNKYGQMACTLPIISRMHDSLDQRSRRRRSNHSLVASMDPATVARRNERERNRVKQVNDGFAALRKKVPFLPDKKKLSKVEILRYAMMYIRDLKDIVDDHDCNNKEPVNGGKSSEESSPEPQDCILVDEDMSDGHSGSPSSSSDTML